jgi:hypothetical protein
LGKKSSAKVYLIDENPPFKGGPPFPPFHPPLKKGGPPFFKGGWTYEPSCPPFLRVDAVKGGSNKGG